MHDDIASATPSRRGAPRRRRRLVALAAAGVAVSGLGLARAATAGDRAVPSPASSTEAALEACLAGKGHALDIVPGDPIVLDDGEIAARYGYGVAEPMASTVAAPAIAPGDELSADIGACAEQVRPRGAASELQAAYGRLAASLTAAEAAGLRDLDAYLASPPGADEALKAWQRCMAGAGHPAESPGAARASIETRAAAGADQRALAADEKALAVADIACREDVLFPALVAVIDRHLAGR